MSGREELVKAWRVGWLHMPSMYAIVAERTRRKAMLACYYNIKEAGWKPNYTEIHARRALEFDSWAAQLAPERIGKGVSEETAKNERQAFLERLKRLHGPGSPEA